MSLPDRSNSTSNTGPSSLLPPEPKRPFFWRKPERLPKQSPNSLLPESRAAIDRDPELEEAVAVSPSSLLPPPEPRAPERLPEHGPSSLLPDGPSATPREPLAEDLLAVSPRSLLPPEPERPLFSRTPEQRLPQVSPSSLLPDAPLERTLDPALDHVVAVSPSRLLPGSTPESYRALAREELVAVSPTELLAPRPSSVLSFWINRRTVGGAGIVALLAALGIFLANYKSVPALMQEAVNYANNDNHDAAIAGFSKVLQRQSDHAEARYLSGRSRLAVGNPQGAEAELRLALAAGWSKREVAPELARAMLRQGKYQALLDELVPDSADPASQSGPVDALRGLAYLALGNEAQARAAFERSLSQSPENADALLGLARIAERAKRFDEADRLVERALRAGGRSADGWLLKGELRWR